MKLAVLSDTHGLLRQEVMDHLTGVDAILHGGDVNNQGIVDTLASVAPLYVVRGNNDREWAESLPAFIDVALSGARIYMTHKKRDLPKDLSPYDLVVYGHSHRYECTSEGAVTLLNPGACGPRRFNQPVTMAHVTILPQEGRPRIAVRRIDIENGPKRPRVPDLRGVVETVMRETARGRPAVEIAKRYGVAIDLVEQIARLYVTHPGVTAEGILGKMGV